MKATSLNNAVGLAEKLEHVFVATADSAGTPHVATAGELSLSSEDHVTVAAWFCPGTLSNLEDNHSIALVVWDAFEDKGFQLLGEVENVEEMAMLNGYAPEIEDTISMPQVERKLHVRVDRVIAFSHAPHSDMEE